MGEGVGEGVGLGVGLGIGVGRSVGARVGAGVTGAAACVAGIIADARPGVLLGRGGGVGLAVAVAVAMLVCVATAAASRIGWTRAADAVSCVMVAEGCAVVCTAGEVVDAYGVDVRSGVGRRLGVARICGMDADVSDGGNGAARDPPVEAAR